MNYRFLRMWNEEQHTHLEGHQRTFIHLQIFKWDSETLLNKNDMWIPLSYLTSAVKWVLSSPFKNVWKSERRWEPGIPKFECYWKLSKLIYLPLWLLCSHSLNALLTLEVSQAGFTLFSRVDPCLTLYRLLCPIQGIQKNLSFLQSRKVHIKLQHWVY